MEVSFAVANGQDRLNGVDSSTRVDMFDPFEVIYNFYGLDKWNKIHVGKIGAYGSTYSQFQGDVQVGILPER